MAWVAAAFLYIVGYVGLNAVSRDLAMGGPRSARVHLNLMFWPVTVPSAWLLDVIFGKE